MARHGWHRLSFLTDTSKALSLHYKYNADGHLSTREDAPADRLDAFYYDGLHRLTDWYRTSPDGHAQVGYGYDDLGNLTSITRNGALQEQNVYGQDQRPHTLTSNSAGAYIYDHRGRQVTAPSRDVTYTEFDLPRTINTTSATTTFAYDAAQSRVKKTTGAGDSLITLGGLYERRESNGFVNHVFYVPGPDGPIAQAVHSAVTGETHIEYIHTDPLGTVGAVTSESGEVIEKLYYEPFGARQDVNGDPVAAPNKDVIFGFATHRHDDELGLIDMRGRVYDPMNRRFLTPDPIVSDPLSGQDYNRYSYVANNPINQNDPTGFCIGTECLGGGGIYGTGYGSGFGFGFGGTSGGGSSSRLPYCYNGHCATNGVWTPTGSAPIQVSEALRPTSMPIGPTAPPSAGGSSVMGPSDIVQTDWAEEAFGGALDAWNHHAAGAAGMLVDVFVPQVRAVQAGWAGAAYVREYMKHGGSGVLALAKAEASGKVAGLSGAVGGLYGLGLKVYNGDPRAVAGAVVHAVAVAGTLAAGGLAGAGRAAETGAARGVGGVADDAFVVRGGVATPDQIARGVGPHRDVPGLMGFSAQSRTGASVEELAATGGVGGGPFPHGQVSVTTAGQLRCIGCSVVPSPGGGANHVTVTPGTATPEDIARQFVPRPNPGKAR